MRGQGSLKIGIENLYTIEPLTENQKLFFKEWKKFPIYVLSGFAGTGKAQPLNCKVKVPGGWINMGDIKPGYTISCPDGSTSKVLGVYPQGIKEVFEVTFKDGRKTRCCDEHLWKLTSLRKTKTIHGDKAVSYINEDVKSLANIRKYDYISARAGIPFITSSPEVDISLPIHPYVVGVLLGDGSLTTSSAIYHNKDDEITKKIEGLGYRVNTTEGIRHTILGISKQLTALDMHHKSINKFVPPIYLNASQEQRLQLIQGLLDTDGYIDKNGCVSFTTTSERLKDDFIYLIRSIGGFAKSSYKAYNFYRDANGDKVICKPSWNIYVRYIDKTLLVSLTRHLEKIISSKEQYSNCNLKIANIQSVGHEECQCILIDHPDHLYITDDFIVTHNTFIAMYKALEDVLGSHRYKKLIILRSAVPTRDLGAMPGDLEEKGSVYELSYDEICNSLFDKKESYLRLKEQGRISFSLTSYIRGITFDESIIIVDEISNLTYHELYSVITRVGEGSKIVFCGDFRQSDEKFNGMTKFLRVLARMKNMVYNIDFTKDDIVRSNLVKEFIIASSEEE